MSVMYNRNVTSIYVTNTRQKCKNVRIGQWPEIMPEHNYGCLLDIQHTAHW